MPHRAHVLRRGAHRRRARDDPRRRRGRPPPALDKLLPLQREDFVGFSRSWRGLPVTIRLLDPPLHEFLPARARGGRPPSPRQLGVPLEMLPRAPRELHEFNPMLGHRGCRLAHPLPRDLRDAGARHPRGRRRRGQADRRAGRARDHDPAGAIANASSTSCASVIDRRRRRGGRRAGDQAHLSVGTMIELPRAALMAGELAGASGASSSPSAPTTSPRRPGLSRDDAGRSCAIRQSAASSRRIRSCPSTVDGVGALVRIAASAAAARGRTSSSASAASTAAIRPRSRSSRRRARLRLLLALPRADRPLAAAQAALRTKT